MDIKDKMDYSLYLDCYSTLFNEYQREIMRLYFDCDVSLKEIASEYNISRQAVRDLIVRGQKNLDIYEEKLGLMKKKAKIAELISEGLLAGNDTTAELFNKIKKEVE